MPLLNSAIPLFAFAALVISEDCCSVASLNYSMPSLHSVTLCRCYAHIFFTPPLLCSNVLCSALAMRCHASPLQSLLGGSTQCRCSASPSIRYHAVAARGFSQLDFAVASQCNALRALPLHNCALPLPNFAVLSLPCLCYAGLHAAQLCGTQPLPLIAFLRSSFASRHRATLRRCIVAPPVLFSALALRSLRVNATPLPSLYKAGRHQAFAPKARTRPCSLLPARTRTCP